MPDLETQGGVAGPGRAAVEYEALRQLFVVVLGEWPDEKLEQALTWLRGNEKLPLPSPGFVTPDILAYRRGAGVAADIVSGVLNGRYESEDYDTTTPPPTGETMPDMPF